MTQAEVNHIPLVKEHLRTLFAGDIQKVLIKVNAFDLIIFPQMFDMFAGAAGYVKKSSRVGIVLLKHGMEPLTCSGVILEMVEGIIIAG
jgi:hypothetical protein